MTSSDEAQRDKVFMSYSHEDREFAEELARALMESGQDVWLDKWEIQPGDSIVQKIFEEGLAKVSAFIVILSKASVRSRWVREELDVATVRRIEDLTRVIPVLKEDVDLPTSLRPLHWVDMREGFGQGLRRVVNALAGVSEKPGLGEAPPHLRPIVEPIAGLSHLASRVGYDLLSRSDPESPFLRAVLNEELAEALAMTPTEVNDAVDELESQGLAKTNDEIGTHPFSFRFVEPTYLLFHAFADLLNYDPREDVRTTLSAIAALDKAGGSDLERHTGLPVGRLNRAVAYIRDHGYAKVLMALGTAPYGFLEAWATRVTRQQSATHS